MNKQERINHVRFGLKRKEVILQGEEIKQEYPMEAIGEILFITYEPPKTVDRCSKDFIKIT